MKGSTFQIERRLPCGTWVRTQRIDPHKLERSDLPRHVKEHRGTGGAPDERRMVEDYANLIFARWLTARPSVEQRLVNLGGR